MDARIVRIILAALLLSSAGFLAAADIPFANTILVYADPGRDWNPGSFDYYLAYIDKEGTPRDWLFDGFLFLSINTPSRRNFWDGKADASDWDWWLERMFEKGRQLDALERDAQALEAKLGQAAPRKVIISIPRPPIAADGAGQAAAIKDFVDRSVRRFSEKSYRSIALDGFYWFHEGVDGTNADLVNSLWQDLHARGLRLYWIPYDVGHENRAHLEKWKAGGIRFDGVWLQPNYFWAERNAKYAAQDLDDTVSVARAMGTGVEIEFDRNVYTTGWKLGRYTHYLMSGDVYGYRDGPLMYYDGYQGYIKCGQSQNPVQRAIYDDLYWFTRKAYLPKPMTYPAVFFEKGAADDPAGQPQIGLWLEKGGGEAGRIYLIEPDPNKDYLIILKLTGAGTGKLEAQVDDGWVPLEGIKAAGGGPARLERYRLARAIIQKIWKPKTPLVLPMRRTGGGTLTAGWARPDDFVFRYLKGKQPMETEMNLELDGSTATLRNAYGEIMIGVRAANAGGKKAGLMISDGPSRTKRAALGSDSENQPLWTSGKPDGDGNVTIKLDPGLEIVELWAFAADAVFHLRPGSCGDTRADLHVPGASLLLDGKWRLAGEFGRNYRIGEAGAGMQVSVPAGTKSRNLVLLVDVEAGVQVEVNEGKKAAALGKINAGKSRRIVIPLKPGEHVLRLSGPVTLHDAWLEHR
jgi:hypothetical protein